MASRPRRNAATNDSDSSTTTAGAAARAKRKKSPSQSQRSSAYRGVTRHRWTGRFEAHLWDRDMTWNHEEPQQAKKKKKKGKQVYLGAYDDEEAAARAHDLAALKYWGPGTVLNFPLCRYDEELKAMEGQSREEYVGSVRRKSSGFSRGVSKYRGVARHHHNGRWEARIGRVLGNKYLYLGTYATQEEAAVAYDVAAIEHRGLNAVTNFDIAHYVNWHRRRQILLGEDGLDIIGRYVNFHGGEHHQHCIIADSCVVAQLPDDDHHQVTRTTPLHDAPPPSSALDLLLPQSSPKFKEIMEEQVISAAAVTTATTESSSTSSPSPTCTSSSSSLSPEPQTEELISGGASSSSARCSFPDDVQTYFQCDDDDGMMSGLDFAEVDTFLFGDLGSYAAPMFQGDLDVFVGP